MVWHGASSMGVRAKQSYCEAWHTDSVSHAGLASDLSRSQILGQETVGCDKKLIVLCIEIASQQHYRRRRDVRQEEDEEIRNNNEEAASTKDERVFSKTLFSRRNPKLSNLTFEEYTQLLDDYDRETDDDNSLGI